MVLSDGGPILLEAGVARNPGRKADDTVCERDIAAVAAAAAAAAADPGPAVWREPRLSSVGLAERRADYAAVPALPAGMADGSGLWRLSTSEGGPVPRDCDYGISDRQLKFLQEQVGYIDGVMFEPFTGQPEVADAGASGRLLSADSQLQAVPEASGMGWQAASDIEDSHRCDGLQAESGLGEMVGMLDGLPPRAAVDTSLSASSSGEAELDPKRSLRGQIRATFLVALAWKRWVHTVNRARAAGQMVRRLEQMIERPLRLALYMLRQNVLVSSGGESVPSGRPAAAGRQAAAGGRPPPASSQRSGKAPRPSDPMAYADVSHTSRAAARLLRMVLRAPVGRARQAALGHWRAVATSRRVAERVATLERSSAEAAQRELEDICGEAAAEAKLERQLRELEAERHERAERLRFSPAVEADGPARLVQILERTKTRLQACRLTSAFASLKHQRLESLLVEEVAERRQLADEIRQLTAADAEVSAEIAAAMDTASARAKTWAVTAGALLLQRLVERRRGHSFHNVRRFCCTEELSRQLEKSASVHGERPADRRESKKALRNKLNALLDDEGTAAVEEGDARQEEDLAASAEPQGPRDALAIASPKPAIHLETSSFMGYSMDTQALALKADRLTKLKARLSVRHDFGTRVHAAPAASVAPRAARGPPITASQLHSKVAYRVGAGLSGEATAIAGELSLYAADRGMGAACSSSQSALDALDWRLTRGAACLLEYVLASLMRSRLRSGVNALLAACQAPKQEVLRGYSRQQQMQLQQQRQQRYGASPLRSADRRLVSPSA
eukprot:TRINITY_DN29793_c0_g1_i1.p1 TRINITY_DN29793_c0_g1~~TRINITY_DN29793_c0_g1_i1.p1  ORF type:complete len:793 (+),score=194.23 TRINITY_DN29793_c0_g1_i1:79-2457(+)